MDIFPSEWEKPHYDFSKNALTQEKIDLGKALFYEGKLSKDGTISCASCHSQYSAFTHTDHDLSHGIGDSIGRRNSPALINLAWQDEFMWDGSIHHLDVQALAPIHNPLEMGHSLIDALKDLRQYKVYRDLYHRAYGDSLMTGEQTMLAMTQFMLTMVSSNSKYDSVMRKEKNVSFTAQESRGYELYKTNCSSCHAEPLFTTNGFANNGLPIDPTLNDLGRYEFSDWATDSLKFKIPTLRNIQFTYPYMHDGRFETIREVLNHYSDGIHQSATLDPSLKNGIKLSSNEKVDLATFLRTLSDRSFMFNKEFNDPRIVLEE
jgi:cytochrome c peroxidase